MNSGKRWYIEARGVAVLPTSHDVKSSRAITATVAELEVKTGVAGGFLFSVGRRINAFLRAEAEAGYRNFGIKSIEDKSVRTPPMNDTQGSVDMASLIGNLYVDFPTGSAISPYVGLGMGAMYLDANDINTGGRVSTTGGRVSLDDNAVALGFQAMVGASFEITDTWAIATGYKYLVIPDLSGRVNSARNPRGDIRVATLQNLELGVRRKF